MDIEHQKRSIENLRKEGTSLRGSKEKDAKRINKLEADYLTVKTELDRMRKQNQGLLSSSDQVQTLKQENEDLSNRYILIK